MSEAVGSKDLALFTIFQTECQIFCVVLPFAIFFYKKIPFKQWDTARKLIFYLLAILFVFLTLAISPFACLSLPLLYAIFFFVDLGYNNLKQLWAKCLHVEIGDNVLDDERGIEGQTCPLDSYELDYLVKDLKDLPEGFERSLSAMEKRSAIEKFHGAVEKVKMILRKQRENKKQKRDTMVDRHLNMVESFEDSESEDEDKLESGEIDSGEAGDEDSFPRKLSPVPKRDYTLRQSSALSERSGGPVETDMQPMATSSGLVPFNTASANLIGLARNTQDERETHGVLEEEDRQGLQSQAAYNPLEWPKTLKEQVLYVILFPPNFVFFFLFPNILDSVSKSKVALMLFIILGCMVGLTILLISVEYTCMRLFQLKHHLVAFFNGIIFIFP